MVVNLEAKSTSIISFNTTDPFQLITQKKGWYIGIPLRSRHKTEFGDHISKIFSREWVTRETDVDLEDLELKFPGSAENIYAQNLIVLTAESTHTAKLYREIFRNPTTGFKFSEEICQRPRRNSICMSR